MKSFIWLLLVFLPLEAMSKEELHKFDTPAGKWEQEHKIQVKSDIYFSCDLNLEEYRNDGEWGPTISLHFNNPEEKDEVAFHVTKSQEDDFLVFGVSHRKNMVTDYDETILSIKRVSDKVKLSMVQSDNVIYFYASDGMNQSSKYFIILPQYSASEATLVTSGAKGTFSCEDKRI